MRYYENDYHENDYYEIERYVNDKKFKHTNDSDYEYAIFTRSFTGRMTKLRYRIIAHFCRSRSFSSHCSHEYDCCGCMHSQRLDFTYKHNQVIVTLTMSFNY